MKYKSFISSYQKEIVPSGNLKPYTKAELSTFVAHLLVFSEGRSVILILSKEKRNADWRISFGI